MPSYASSTGWLGKGSSKFSATEFVEIDSYGYDAAFKWQGFSLQGEYLSGEAKGKTTGKALKSTGYYVQTGYMITPKFELAARYSSVDYNKDKTNDSVNDKTLAGSWYIDKHNLKIQADITKSHDEASSTGDTTEYRIQVQVAF
jgi:phosphate-selective porin OprO/OprP